MLTVLDYGAGNLASLAGALAREKLDFRLVDHSDGVEPSDGPLVLPGVGHFRSAKEALVERGLWRALERAIAEGRPVVGICLGLQLLAEGSEEETWLCRCGHSSNKPFCDGTHRKIGFTAPGA